MERLGFLLGGGLGHIHLGQMPATRKWKTVADMIERGSAINDIAAASAKAAERELARAADDPVFVEAVRLLALIPQAAKQEGFGKALLAIGIDAPADPSLMDLMVATTAALDRFAMREGHRSDFGELSARALSDSLAAAIGPRLPGLFAPNAAQVQMEAARLARSDAFSSLARHFFGRLVSETLQSWLSRKLSANVGQDRASPSTAARPRRSSRCSLAVGTARQSTGMEQSHPSARRHSGQWHSRRSTRN